MVRQRNLEGYRRERELCELLGLKHVAFSGSKAGSYGSEDGEDDERLMQFKSTASNKLTVDFADLFAVLQHADKRMPGFVLDFISPKVKTPSYAVEISPEIWVAVPLDVYMTLYTAWQARC